MAKTGIQTRAPHDAYIRALFDGYADHYDRHLLVDLDYQGANLISRAVGQRLAAFAQPRVADLGCGTGLCGVLLRDRAAALVGIDLSAEMLQQAHARNLYDALHQCHIEVFLRTRPRRFELLVAADVLVYIGDLRPLLRAAADSLVPGGYFAFTTETCSSKRGYRLTRSGRYAHDPEQLRQLACQCGLQPVLLQSQPLRRQGHSSVQGNLVLLQRAADNRLT